MSEQPRLYACPNGTCARLLFVSSSGECPNCGARGLKNWRLKPRPGRENGHRGDARPSGSGDAAL